MDWTERARERQENWRRLLASVKQQGSIVLSSVPERVSESRPDSTTMRLFEVLDRINGHVASLLYLLTGSKRTEPSPGAWSAEVERFFDTIERLDSVIAAMPGSDSERILNLNHDVSANLGQVTILLWQIERIRRTASSPAEDIDDSGNRETGDGPPTAERDDETGPKDALA